MEDLDTKAPNIHELNTEISSLLLNIHEVMTRLFLVIKQRILYVVILLCMLQLLLWMAIFLYATFYYTFMPRATFSTPIHFYYSVWLSSSSDYCSFPVANFSLLQNGKTQVMAHGQPYRITLELEMPESPANMQLGMFLVKMSCYSHDQQIVDTSVRSAMLRYRSELLQTLETAMFIPLMLMGAFEQKQQILVELYSSYTDSSNKPTIGAIIEIQSLQVQIYKAQLHIHAHFSGIRYILYHFPLTASVVGVMSNFIFLSALFLMSYLRDGLGSIWMNLTSEEWNKIIEWTTDTQETTSQYERSTHTEMEDNSNDLRGFSKEQSLFEEVDGQNGLTHRFLSEEISDPSLPSI